MSATPTKPKPTPKISDGSSPIAKARPIVMTRIAEMMKKIGSLSEIRER
jgi:hypothetical protein